MNRCIALGSWLKSVKNQIWHSIGSCEGNLDKLIEMILASPSMWSASIFQGLQPQKHTFFGPQKARVRACLAAIDHNFNVNRPAKKDIDGDAKYTYKFTRDGMTYTAIPVKVPKITTWRTDIMNEVVEAVRCSAVPSLQTPTDNHLKLYGKMRNPKPDMAELVAATKARNRYRVQSKR